MLGAIGWGQTVSSAEKISVLARKLAAARAGQMPDITNVAPEFDMPMHSIVDPAERAWRISLARAARDHMKLALGFESLQLSEVGLIEVLETPMERALILMLEGAGDALGLMIISSPILSGMIEMLTLSRLASDFGDAPRSPTRTDAAMVVDMIDAALTAFAQAMAEQGASQWSQPYHYAAFIEDPRPLHLMLEDGSYRLLRAEVHLEHGTRQGSFTLALPVQADFHLELPAPTPDFFAQDAGLADVFTAELSEQIAAVPTHLDAVLAQITLPLDRILRLQAGEVLALGAAGLDSIQLQGIDGLALAAGKLGQQRGMRAIRLHEAERRLSDLGGSTTAQTSAVMSSMANANGFGAEGGLDAQGAPYADGQGDAQGGFATPIDLLQVG